jgi:carboxyl-terminal processing protease
VFFRAEGDLRVRYVEKASPAGKAGIRRGWKITKFNGSSNVNTGNSNAIVDAVYYSQNTTFEFLKPDGSTAAVTLAAASYTEDPIFLDTVYTAGSNKIGYLVFNSFLGDTNAIYNSFQRVFAKFSAENVKDVVVDLRYNGGGYVSVQEKLANYIVKPAASGGLMMKEVFNTKYQRYNETINFSKLGSLNPNRVFFIVSDNTASASELLINNLKPYMEVKLVGPTNTYGKPVGYFPIEVGDWYIFPVSFRSTNKNGEGNYFDGIVTDSKSGDGLDKDWGNIQEASLANVLSYITSGAFVPLSATRTQAATAELTLKNKIFSDRSFKGAISRPKTIRP